MDAAAGIELEAPAPPTPAGFFMARALAASLLLHAGVAVWLLKPGAPAIVPPQPIPIEIVMAAAPQPEKVADTPPPAPKMQKAEAKPDAPPHHERKSAAQPSPPALNNAPERTEGANERIIQPQFDAAYLRNPPPDYPALARRGKIEGTVLLKVDVSEDGEAETVAVEKSSGSDMLDESARDAVRRWRFVPARRGGRAVAAAVTVPVIFRLE